jgi:hypothetical protein
MSRHITIMSAINIVMPAVVHGEVKNVKTKIRTKTYNTERNRITVTEGTITYAILLIVRFTAETVTRWLRGNKKSYLVT